MTPSAAHSVACQRCGAPIAVPRLVPEVVCPHCQHRQALDRRLLGDLHAYQHAVARDVGSAQEHYDVAARFDVQAQQVRKPSLHYLLAFGLMGGLPMVIVLGGTFAARSGYLSQQQFPLISFAAIGAAMVGMVIYVAWSVVLGRRKAASSTGLGASAVACPSCGAEAVLHHGQALERCTYCGAALMATATIIQAGLDAARATRRRAELERWRKERSLVVSYSGFALSGTAVMFLAAGPMVLCTGAGAVMFSYQMATGDEPYSHGIFALWGVLLALLLFLVGGTGWVRSRKRTLRGACESLAAQLGGHPIEELQQMAHWLNTYWAGPYDTSMLLGAGLYGGTAGVVEGYATLVELFASGDKYRQPRLRVLVAAWLPGLSDGGGPAPPLNAAATEEKAWLRQHGYHVEATRAGLLVRGEKQEVKRVRKRLGEFARLAPVLVRVARLARAMGAAPVDGMA